MNHKDLDQWAYITSEQKKLTNLFLILICEKTVDASEFGSEEFNRRKEQLAKFKEVLEIEDCLTTKEIVRHWWEEEIKKECELEQSLYRTLMMLVKNLNTSPFVKEEKGLLNRKTIKKTDSDLFEKNAAKSIHFFISETKDYFKKQNLHTDKVKIVEKLEALNFDQLNYRSRYKLLGKDLEIGKGFIVGATAGIAASVVMGPVIGAFIGEVAGLSGAAATSYGLAVLGGGSLASGGLGMAGGTLLVGLGFGTHHVAQNTLNEVEIDMMSLHEAQKNLPIFLVVGKIFLDEINRDVARAIHKKIDESLRMYKDRLYYAQDESDEKEKKKRIQSLSQTIKYYESASHMSENYDWISGYDLFIKIKDLAS